MFALIIFLTSLFLVIAIGAKASLSDLKGLTIPNKYAVGALGIYVGCFLLLALLGQAAILPSLISSLLAALIFFGITFAMFSFKILGAADSKLGTVLSLWIGLKALPVFLFYMTLTGGVLALGALFLKKKPLIKAPLAGSWVDEVQKGNSKVPYGVAIFVGLLATFAKLGYFGYETFVLFLTG